MCMITLATGSLVGYAYAMEFFIAWYVANSTKVLASLTVHLVTIGGLTGS